MIAKTVKVANTEFVIHGQDADPYFQNVEAHLEHGNFLVPLLAYHVSRGATLIDVGANIGATTSLMNRLVDDAEVVSIEPSKAFDSLTATVKSNGFAKTRCLQMCVGGEDGTVNFLDTGDYTGKSESSASHSHVSLDASVAGRAVPVKKLDTIARDLELSAVDFVKIDVEGFEWHVLDGMQDVNAKYRPLIFMEFNSFALSIHGNMSPYAILRRVRDEFECFFAVREGKLQRFQTDVSLATFFLENMTKSGCVDDIAFTASPDRRAAFQL